MKTIGVAALLLLCSCLEVQRRPVYVPPPPPHPVYLPPQPGPAAITADQAAQIAAGFASQRGFNVHKVKRVDLYGRLWEVRLQGHPPTPGKMRVLVDAVTGQVMGMDQYWGQGHAHHGHNHEEEGEHEHEGDDD
jgi:hypothetical protein